MSSPTHTMKPGAWPRQRGLSLVELVVSMAIAGAVIVAGALVYADAIRIWNETESRIAMQKEMDFALTQIESAIRLGKYVTVTSFYGERDSRLKIHYDSDFDGTVDRYTEIKHYPRDGIIMWDHFDTRDFNNWVFRPHETLVPLNWWGDRSDNRRYVTALKFAVADTMREYRGRVKKKMYNNLLHSYTVVFTITMMDRYGNYASMRSAATCNG